MTEPKKLDPLISEFETQEQADSYDRWYRMRVQEGLDDDGPTFSHEQVMAEMRDIIKRAAARGKRKRG